MHHLPSSISWQERLAAADASLRVHLLGIGGSGLSAIAHVLLEMGIQVSGSDRQQSAATRQLSEAGATIYEGQRAENLTGMTSQARPHVVLISSAIDANNPERGAAEQLEIPVVKRSEFLPALFAQRQLIAVAGTHGKSTTTSMIVKTLREAGIETGYIIGATLPGFGNASAGRSPWFVIEADEYDRMFHGLHPTIAVITNVEWDHPDCYPTPESFQQAFLQFVDCVQTGGLVVTCADDPGAEIVGNYAESRGLRCLRYAIDVGCKTQDATLQPTTFNFQLSTFNLQIALFVPGLHNVRNALAAWTVASECGVDTAQAIASLNSYTGVGRRFEIKGERAGIVVIDDYAHHPTEVRATLSAARSRYPTRRIWAVFQPHTYSRTKNLLGEMAASFADADRVIISDIYAAREQNDGSIHAADLVAASTHPAICHIAQLSAISQYLSGHVKAGDVVITLGAGDGNRVGEWLLESLRD